MKTIDQPAVLMTHKVRELLVRQRTALINALRGHLAEFGIVAAQGSVGLKHVITQFQAEQANFPVMAQSALRRLIERINQITDEVRKTEKEIVAWCRADAPSRRLITIPGVGPITASAISASVPDPALFRSGRQFAAWLGLTPRPHSSGGKERLGRTANRATARSGACW